MPLEEVPEKLFGQNGKKLEELCVITSRKTEKLFFFFFFFSFFFTRSSSSGAQAFLLSDLEPLFRTFCNGPFFQNAYNSLNR